MGQGQVEVSQEEQVVLELWVEPQVEQVEAQEAECLERRCLVTSTGDWALVGDLGVGLVAEQGEGRMTAGHWVGAYSGEPMVD